MLTTKKAANVDSTAAIGGNIDDVIISNLPENFNSPVKEISMLDAALEYAARGWPIFPCDSKKPIITGWQESASINPDQIRKWWQRWPNAKIGYAVPKNVVVIDVDINHDAGKFGDESKADWEEANGAFPDTVQSLTGGGGQQYFFKTDQPVKNKVGLLPSVDVRAAGGLAILPPSLHKSGRRYEWELSSHPDDIPMAPLPDALYKLMTTVAHNRPLEVPDKILSGERNDTLFRLACSLRAKGLSELEILATLSAVNRERCEPQIDDKELRTIAHSSANYEPGDISTGKKKPRRKSIKLSLKDGGSSLEFMPNGFTDADNAALFIEKCNGEIRFCETRGWLVWNGKQWQTDDLKVNRFAQEFTRKMRDEARTCLRAAKTPEEKDFAEAYMKFASKSRNKGGINAIIELAKALCYIAPKKLDADPLILNTPTGIVDLKTGEIKLHTPNALCTKMTAIGPSAEGTEIWNDFLKFVTCGNKDLERYIQIVMGMSIVGTVQTVNPHYLTR